MFNILNSIFNNLLNQTKLDFYRYFYTELEENIKVIWIVWERWIWKTTSLLQFAKTHEKSFYFSADNSIVQSYWLFKFVFELFNDYSIENILIDEIHKYPNWTLELKNIIDSFPNKKIIFSWSSSLDIISWTSSLERRVKIIKVYPLNFSEFLKLYYNIDIPNYTFEEIISDYKKISFELSNKVLKKHIEHYIRTWFYPYSRDFKSNDFFDKIFNTQEKIIIEDLPSFINFQTSTLIKVKKIFYFIANTLPWDLNYSSLARKIWVNSDTLENIVFILSKIWVINLIPKSIWLSDMLRKEFKIYLWNPNLYYSYDLNTNIWIIRESFIIHFLKRLINSRNEIQTDLSLPTNWDILFTYNNTNYIFEIWWKNKTKKQIKNLENAFIVSDDIIISEYNKIPLWLFWLIKW
jgi:hypothetical protein